MRHGFYSEFWLSGGVLRSLLWRDRDAAAAVLEGPTELVHQAETLDMGAWLRLPDGDRCAVVEQYARRRPALSRLLV